MSNFKLEDKTKAMDLAIAFQDIEDEVVLAGLLLWLNVYLTVKEAFDLVEKYENLNRVLKDDFKEELFNYGSDKFE